jgi:ABC-2 type transport system ATP-binding protein
MTGRTIETDALTKCFGGFTAVDRISLRVSRGEIFGFLGPNGAGKTTAIRMLCGLLTPTRGGGRVAGYDIVRQTALIRTRIGYMSQKFSLYSDLRVIDNMRLYGAIYGLTSAQTRERISTLSRFLDMDELLSQRTGSLPWGWQQRLSLACANLHQPAVLFLDEPTGSVDPLSRRSFWELIRSLSRQGSTIFVSTHHMDEAEYCHRISLMNAGRLVAVDSPANLKRAAGCKTLQEVFLRLLEQNADDNQGETP